MPITVMWDNKEKTVLRYEYHDPWNWRELDIAMDSAHVMLGSVQHKARVIIDLRNSESLPGGPLGRIRNNTPDGFPPNADLSTLAMVGATGFTHSFAHTFSRLYSRIVGDPSTVFAATLEEARARLAASTGTQSARRDPTARQAARPGDSVVL